MLVPFFLLLWDFHLYLIQLELLLQVQLCEVNQILMEPYPQPWRSNIDQVPLEIRTLLLLIEELIQSLQISFPSFQDDSIRMLLNLNQGFFSRTLVIFFRRSFCSFWDLGTRPRKEHTSQYTFLSASSRRCQGKWDLATFVKRALFRHFEWLLFSQQVLLFPKFKPVTRNLTVYSLTKVIVFFVSKVIPITPNAGIYLYLKTNFGVNSPSSA